MHSGRAHRAKRKREVGKGMFCMCWGLCERADVIPEIHDQWATPVAGALSAHTSATQPVGKRAGEIDAIPVTSNPQSCVSWEEAVMATTVVFGSRRSHGYL